MIHLNTRNLHDEMLNLLQYCNGEISKEKLKNATIKNTIAANQNNKIYIFTINSAKKLKIPHFHFKRFLTFFFASKYAHNSIFVTKLSLDLFWVVLNFCE